jgi:hypothetical protein
VGGRSVHKGHGSVMPRCSGLTGVELLLAHPDLEVLPQVLGIRPRAKRPPLTRETCEHWKPTKGVRSRHPPGDGSHTRGAMIMLKIRLAQARHHDRETSCSLLAGPVT